MLQLTRILPGNIADPVGLRFANPGALDAFARQRISAPVTLFDSASEYNAGPLLFASKLTGGGAVTHLPAESAVAVSTGGGAADAAIRSTLQYFRYQPGKSQLIILTGVMGPAVANTIKRYGYYDANNGLFFQVDANGFAVVQRSSTSGIPVDLVTYRASFNMDRLDGSGNSDFVLDLEKANIFIIDFEWLGVGSVRFGVFSPAGEPLYFHQIQNANARTLVYMRTANLPVRAEVVNTGVTAGGSIKTICASVISEGGFEENRGYPFAVGTGITGLSTTTRRPIVTIRPRATFGGLTNRGLIIPEHIEILSTAQAAYYEIVYGGTVSGGTFANVDANNSIAEYSIDSTGIAGGIRIDDGYLPTGAGATTRFSTRESLAARLPLCLDIDGANPKELSIVATAFTGTATVNGSISWKELY